MSSNLVSVIIPSFNSINFIKRAIDSVIYDNYVGEVIVVDDGSTDGTRNLIQQLSFENLKLKLVTHENLANKGACASRNLGLKNSKYEWIQFLDSDDELIAGKFHRQLEILSRGNFDLLLGSYYMVSTRGTYLIHPETEDLWLGFNNYLLGTTNSNLWRKSSIVGIGGWKEGWPSNQDYEILLRALINNFKITFDLEPSCNYFKRSGSISGLGSNRGWQTQIILRLDLSDYLFKTDKLNYKRSFFFHKFIYKKLIMIRRVKELYNDYVNLNDRFIKSEWYSEVTVFRSVPKSIVYKILGFNLTELCIRLVKR